MNMKYKERYKQLGLNIAYYRKSKGLSQLKLSEQAEISRTHMSRIETGDVAISVDVIFAICDALGISTAELFEIRYKI